MKKIKIFGFIMLLTFVAAVGCSKDEVEQNSTSDLQLRTFGGGIDDYLSDYYGNASLKFNDSIKASDSLGDYLVKSIVVGNDLMARGYVVYDFTSGSPLYFADVDRSGYKMSTKDFITDEEETLTNIDDEPIYDYNNLDIIGMIYELNTNGGGGIAAVIQDVEFGQFWGSSLSCSNGGSINQTFVGFDSNSNPMYNCTRNGCTKRKFRFFVSIGSSTVNGVPVNCSDGVPIN